MEYKIVWLLTLHFVADFLLQSREMGKKKSSEPHWLFAHLLIQWLVVGLGACLVMPAGMVIWFTTFNALIHGVIDWNIWNFYKLSVKYRLLKIKPEDFNYTTEAEWHVATTGSQADYLAMAGRNWKYWDDHLFYTTIGFDQLLHSITIVLLARLFI